MKLHDLDPATQERIDNNFKYHPPSSSQQSRYVHIRGQAKDLAETIATMCPDSPERSRAMQAIEETVMWANAAIARNEHPDPQPAPQSEQTPRTG